MPRVWRKSKQFRNSETTRKGNNHRIIAKKGGSEKKSVKGLPLRLHASTSRGEIRECFTFLLKRTERREEAGRKQETSDPNKKSENSKGRSSTGFKNRKQKA